MNVRELYDELGKLIEQGYSDWNINIGVNTIGYEGCENFYGISTEEFIPVAKGERYDMQKFYTDTLIIETDW